MTQISDLARAVEACLFAAEEPMTREAISAHLGDADVADALGELQAAYEGRGIVLVERGKRFGVVDIGAHRVGFDAVCAQRVQVDLVGPPERVGLGHAVGERRGVGRSRHRERERGDCR